MPNEQNTKSSVAPVASILLAILLVGLVLTDVLAHAERQDRGSRASLETVGRIEAALPRPELRHLASIETFVYAGS